MTALSQTAEQMDIETPIDGVTIIIPAYKAQATLEQAVRSALNQGPDVKSIVVVIDGPSASTQAVAKQLADPRVDVIVNETRRGAPFCRNRGLALASTDHVMFLDADDYVEGGLIAGLVAQVKEQDADICFGPWRSMDSDSGRTSAPFYPDFVNASDLVTGWLARREYVPPCAVLWQRSFLLKLGGWDEALIRNQDGELVIRAVLQGARFRCSSRGMGIWIRYPHKGSVSSRLDTAIHMLDAPTKLLTLRSDAVPHQVLRRACAQHLYASASFCFANGNPTAGRAALQASRKLGFRGHRGRGHVRLLAYTLGLERAYRVKRAAAPLRHLLGRGRRI